MGQAKYRPRNDFDRREASATSGTWRRPLLAATNIIFSGTAVSRRPAFPGPIGGATLARASESIRKMTSGGAHRRSKVGFKRSGKRHVLHFPALVQRRRMTVWGLSLIADADRVRHRTGRANQQHSHLHLDQ